MPAQPPLIILGMHRSGTSALTRMLRRLGLFAGRGLTRNDEAPFFVRCNDWLLHQAGGTWHTPEPMQYLLDEPQARQLTQQYLARLMQSPQSAWFLGTARTARFGSLARFPRPWGWKDPRTVFTLPIWLSIFPDARVVHIRRHGLDVAASLQRRRDNALQRMAGRYQQRGWLYHLHPKPPKARGWAHAPRCATIEGGLDLWEAYMTRATRHLDALGQQALDLKYETLLHQPVATLQRIARFAGLEPQNELLEDLTVSLDPARADAHRRDPTLRQHLENHAHRLHRFGYE